MKHAQRMWTQLSAVLTVGAAGACIAGCQTPPAGFGGMTLPSPHYLQHPPQYFPPDPPFSLQRELDSMQDPEGLTRRGLGAGPAPIQPVPSVLPGPVPSGPTPAIGVPAGMPR